MPLNDTKARPRRHNENGPAKLVAAQATVTDPETTPHVAGRLAKRRDGGWSLIVDRCPFCAKAHTHGAPGGLDTRETSRVSHCHLVASRTYRIVVGGPAA